MITAWLRKVSARILEAVAAAFRKLGFGPNGLTILGCALNIAVAIVIATGNLQLGGLLLIVASAFDGVDGTLARQMGRPTKFGAFLDSTLDRVSESAIMLGISWWYMQQPGIAEEILAYITIVGSLLVSYTRARAEGIGVDCKVGLFTRVERCILIIAALILGLTSQALWVLAVGTVLTTAHRAIHVYLQTRDMPLDA